MIFEVGTHHTRHRYVCLVCATRFYDDLKGFKYLVELDSFNRPIKMINNTYGWKNV